MSNKYRHTAIILLILSSLLLIGEIIVVTKFFTKEEFKEITYTQDISQNIDYSLSNSEDTNDFNLAKTISKPSNNFNNEFSRSNISTSSRFLITRQNIKTINTNKNEENIKNATEKSTINSNEHISNAQKIENTKNNSNDNTSTTIKVPKNVTKKQSTQKTNTSTTQISQDTIGNITIPKTGVNLPIMKTVTLHNMDTATCFLYSTGILNQNGTTIIIGHNYKNGKLFSNNSKLKKGDKIYITTQGGHKKEYTIYDKFITSDDDISYLEKNKDNSPQIALSSCTDDEKNRIIILAK